MLTTSLPPHFESEISTAPAVTALKPLSPRELVTDEILRLLAHGDAARDRGEISEDDQRTLAMLLPDICGELLSRRAVMIGGDA